MVERCQDLQKQRCPLENKMQTNGGACLQRFHLELRKLVVESGGIAENIGEETNLMRRLLRVRRREDETPTSRSRKEKPNR